MGISKKVTDLIDELAREVVGVSETLKELHSRLAKPGQEEKKAAPAAKTKQKATPAKEPEKAEEPVAEPITKDAIHYRW